MHSQPRWPLWAQAPVRWEDDGGSGGTGDVLCAVHRSLWRLCCDKEMTKQKCSRSSKSVWNLNTQKPDDFWFAACDDAIWKGNRVWIHSFERKLSALSNGVSGKVVQRISFKLFDLKARGDIFLITLYKEEGPKTIASVIITLQVSIKYSRCR